jgi:transposase InsO family protein
MTRLTQITTSTRVRRNFRVCKKAAISDARRGSDDALAHRDPVLEELADALGRLLERDDGLHLRLVVVEHPERHRCQITVIGTIKAELLDGAPPDDVHAVQRELFPYVESFYNRRRLHSTLGYITPSDKELLAISDRQVA